MDIYNNFKTGLLTSIDIKNITADKIIDLITKHNQIKNALTNDDINKFLIMDSMK